MAKLKGSQQESPEERTTNALIAVIWPLLDSGTEASEIDAIYRNVMDSWEPAEEVVHG